MGHTVARKKNLGVETMYHTIANNSKTVRILGQKWICIKDIIFISRGIFYIKRMNDFSFRFFTRRT